MVAPAGARPRPPAQIPTVTARGQQSRSKAMYVLLAVPLLLVASLVWQVAFSALHTEAVVRRAVGVGQVTLEATASGTRVDMVMVDKYGQETTFQGTLDLSLREPDGAVWQSTRTVAGSDFQPLPDDSLIPGRTGYTFSVNARDWARPPRRGGLATISINATPNDGGPSFTSQSQQRFP